MSSSTSCSVQEGADIASDRSQRTRDMTEVTAASCAQHLEVKEEVEAASWLMHFVISMEQIFYGHEEHDSQIPEYTRRATSAIKKRATRLAEWSERPSLSQETLRKDTAMETDDGKFLPEFDAVHVWTLRDRVIIEQM